MLTRQRNALSIAPLSFILYIALPAALWVLSNEFDTLLDVLLEICETVS